MTVIAKQERVEQLQRWESSEMNGEPPMRRKAPRVQFQDGDIFLSACMSGDEDEVDELLGKGADINTSTVDGLTALHQSVIDSKPEMVRFLCEKGADINAQDNEGWTPLHAAACCGNLAIVKYLCQKGADLSIVNSDKELPLDLAEDDLCREFLESDYRRRGIEPEKCRDQELSTMLRDVQTWIRDGEFRDRPHPRTGATAMHVAAGKGYTQVLELLLKAGGSVRSRDRDGWTPLHAAAHWGERDSCKILMEHGARVVEETYAGMNVLAVADKDVVEYLEELEQSMEKRKTTSPQAVGMVPNSSILQEKNRLADNHAANVVSHHAEHTVTTDHKRDLQHRDQSSEKEVMQHTTPKMPRLAERTPSAESPTRSSSASRTTSGSVSAEDERMPSLEKEQSPLVEDEESIIPEEPLPPSVVAATQPHEELSDSVEDPQMAVDSSGESHTPSSSARSSEDRSSASQERSLASNASSTALSTSSRTSFERSGSSTTAPSITNSIQKLSSVQKTQKPAKQQFLTIPKGKPPPAATSNNSKVTAPKVTTKKDGSSASSLQSGDQHVSATVQISAPPRAMQQPPSSWINRGVPLVTRSSSSSMASTTSTSTASRLNGTSATSSSSENTSSSGATASGVASSTASASTSATSPLVSGLSKPPVLHSSSMSSLSRSTSTPSNLPWVSLCRVSSKNGTTTTTSSGIGGYMASPTTTSFGMSPTSAFASIASPTSSSVLNSSGTNGSTSSSSSLTPQFLSQSRTSAFRPLAKSTSAVAATSYLAGGLDNSTASLQQAGAANSYGEYPRGFQPQHLSAMKMRPWQSNTVNESEAERRSTARMQRQQRRSTQGVSKEQLEEASRIAEEASAARRRGLVTTNSTVSNSGATNIAVTSPVSSHPPSLGLARLASEERDLVSSSSSLDRSNERSERLSRTASGSASITRSSQRESMERSSDVGSASMDALSNGSDARSSPNTTNATLMLPAGVPPPGQTPSASAGIRRKSQGLSLSRSNRRGTGPVAADDVHAALTLRSIPAETAAAPGTGAPMRYSGTTSTTMNNLTNIGTTTTRGYGSSRYDAGLSRSGSTTTTGSSERSEKSHSAPPPSHPPPLAPPPTVPLRSVHLNSNNNGGAPTTMSSNATTTNSGLASTVIRTPVTSTNSNGPTTTVIGHRAQARVAGQPAVASAGGYSGLTSGGSSASTGVASSASSFSFSAGRPSETNLNYKTLYEKERAENDRLRKEIDDIRKNDPNRLSYRFRNGSPATSSVLPVTRSASGASVEDVADRKSYEKRIAELEFQLKGMNQVKNENQRLKEENGALVRVISKMTI